MEQINFYQTRIENSIIRNKVLKGITFRQNFLRSSQNTSKNINIRFIHTKNKNSNNKNNYYKMNRTIEQKNLNCLRINKHYFRSTSPSKERRKSCIQFSFQFSKLLLLEKHY